jgi:hypothetical protein
VAERDAMAWRPELYTSTLGTTDLRAIRAPEGLLRAFLLQLAWVPATDWSAALAVAHSECSGERSADSFISAHARIRWRRSFLITGK